MVNLNTIQQDITSLPLDVQQSIIELVDVLKKQYLPNQQESKQQTIQDWTDFIGCVEAEPNFSRNYKTYLANELDQKYNNR